MRRSTIFLTILLIVSLVVVARTRVAGLAQQDGFSGPGRYRVEIVATGYALDLKLEDKKTVQQWAGNSGARNQQWDVEDAGDGYFYLKSAENGLTLDFAERRVRDGLGVIVAQRSGSDNQKWKIADNGKGEFTIISKSGKSLELPAGKRDQGVRLQVWGPHGLENQRFKFTRLGDLEVKVRPRDGSPVANAGATNTGFVGKGRYRIQIVASGGYLDLRLEDRETLQQWTEGGGRNQWWDVEDAGGGYVYLRSAENGRVLEAAGARDGSAIYARDFTGRDNQKWRIVDLGNGQALILSGLRKALDLPNGAPDSGTKLQVWSEHRRDNQRFRFHRVEQQADTYTGGRTRGGREPEPARASPNPPEPYSPGRMRWRGRVDIEVLLEVRRDSVTEKNVTGRSFNNGRYTFSAPMPARELELRIENKKVRGSVEVVEKPSPSNNYTALIRVRDPQKDAADYEFELSW
jgi:hypothetical protein